MFLSTIPNDFTYDFTYDFIVIGSGPAGLTLALQLGQGTKRVLVLKSGDEERSRNELSDTVAFGHYSGDHWNQHAVRSLGGTSNAWSGWCITPRNLDFENPAVGVSWPVSVAELRSYS